MEEIHSISVSRLCVYSLQKGELHLEATFCFSNSKIMQDTPYICLGFASYLHYPLAGWLLHKANGEVSSQCAATLVLSKTVQTWLCAIHGRKSRQSLRRGSSISQGRVKGNHFQLISTKTAGHETRGCGID